MATFRATLTVGAFIAILLGLGLSISDGKIVLGLIFLASGIGALAYVIKAGPV